jgi:hypothetical protein
MAKLSSDLCTITEHDGTDYFIRTVLEVPIRGAADPFTWGVWVSLSEKSFNRYVETYDNPVEGDGFFGWLCNRLPHYSETIGLATDVRVQPGGMRPTVHLHQGGSSTAHQLVIDQREGIDVSKAQELAEHVTHGTQL